MATLKLKKPPNKPPRPAGANAAPRQDRPPVRGGGAPPRPRPTLAQAQADRGGRGDRGHAPAGGGGPGDTDRRGDEPPRHGDRGRGVTVGVGPTNTDRRGNEPAWQGQGRHGPAAGTAPANADRRGDERTGRGDPWQRRDAGAGFGDADRRGPGAQRDDRPIQPIRPPHAAATPQQPRQRPPPSVTQQQQRPPARPQQQPSPPPRRPPGGNASGAAARRDARFDNDDDDAPQAHAEIPGSLRLSKRMSQLGMASRREADEWIAKGWVRVDDQVVSQLGSRVVSEQRITIDARAKFQQAQKVTVLLNKPVGWVSGQAEDGYEPAVVLVTPQNQWRDDRSGTRFLREHLKNLVPAGRLDIDSVGLLVLTQDGRIAKQLVGENADIEKEYLVRVATLDGQPLPAHGLQQLRHGIELDGEPLREAQVEWLNDDQLRFVLKEGKKRQIRRMCEAVGLRVLGLKRVRIGPVVLGDLPVGQWRYLRGDESFG